MARFVKVYGERNTGTNYLSQLLEGNLTLTLLPGVVPTAVTSFARNSNRLVRRLGLPGVGELIRDRWFDLTFGSNLGWKHMLVRPPLELEQYGITRQTFFVTLTKNPYAWLLSLFDHPYHGGHSSHEDFVSFLRAPWRTVGREGMDCKYTSPVDLWNQKNAAYLKLADRFPALVLKYETLVLDPSSVVDRVEESGFGQRRVTVFENVVFSTKGDSSRTFETYRRYYLNEEWREEVPPECLDIINGSLDLGILHRFGYDLVSH